jgi:ADP-heptose:LPS heptosyltransferase
MPGAHAMMSPLRRNLKGLLASRAARLARRPLLTPAALHALRPCRLLIVRQHNQMGDMICATPTFRALRATYPDAEIGLVCAPVNFEVVRHNPDLDRVFVFAQSAWRRPARLIHFLHAVRAFRPELTVVLNSVSFSVTSAWIAAVSGARYIVGGDSRPFGWDISQHVYSLELPSRPALDRHAVLHSLAPLAAVGITTTDLATVVVPSSGERAAAASLLSGIAGSSSLCVLHPGAGKRDNLWPAERFAAIAGRAVAAGWRVLVLHGPADGVALARFRAALGREDPGGGGRHGGDAAAPAGSSPAAAGVTVAPRLPVGVCAAILARADRFLCNDTGLMHVAGAVGTPTLALFGPTDPELWKPLAAQVRALRGEGGSLDRLDAETVWRALSALPTRQAGAD